MSRIRNTMLNIKVAYMGQVFVVIMNFITRRIFVETLNAELLGINGLFTNIMSLLSLAELGIGSAIIYSMYKPLAKEDHNHINSLLRFYKTTYYRIGLTVFLLGITLTPFLNHFISGATRINNLEFIYVLYVIGTSSTYFFSYKRSFLIANQKKYIDSAYHYFFVSIRYTLQILVLLILKNFYGYLVLQFVVSFIENITISNKINKLYPYINTKNKIELIEDDKRTIYKNVRALVMHKVGSVVVMGTDNILISKLVSLTVTGIYSNYILIVTAINQFINIFFQSLTATIGNLAATESKDRQMYIFDLIDYMGFWLYGFSSISLYVLMNQFISIWLGDGYLLNNKIVMLIVVSFYLTGRRWSVLTYKDALGLFWYDRYKPIFESLINLIASIWLGIKIGIAGILIGTIVSTIFTCFWIEPYVLYKYGFNKSVKNYFVKYITNTLYLLFVGYITLRISNIVNIGIYLDFFISMIICLIIPNLLLFIPFYRSKHFNYIWELLANKIKSR